MKRQTVFLSVLSALLFITAVERTFAEVKIEISGNESGSKTHVSVNVEEKIETRRETSSDVKTDVHISSDGEERHVTTTNENTSLQTSDGGASVTIERTEEVPQVINQQAGSPSLSPRFGEAGGEGQNVSVQTDEAVVDNKQAEKKEEQKQFSLKEFLEERFVVPLLIVEEEDSQKKVKELVAVHFLL